MAFTAVPSSFAPANERTMVAMHNTDEMKKRNHNRSKQLPPAVRYWLLWALIVAALAYGVHRYFEYRNAELDRRIEQLN